MRVLMVLPAMRKGGAEKLTCDIAIEMQKHPGVEVKVVCFHNINTYPQLSSQLDIQWIPSKVSLSISGKSYFELDNYKRLVNDFKPQVIHSHLFEAEIISRSIEYPVAKYFTHCHDNMHQFANFGFKTLFNKKKLTEYYEKRYLMNRYRENGGNNFISISKDNFYYFTRVLPADLRNVTLLHNAINFPLYNSVNNDRSLDTIRIVNTGSFIPKKNQIFLVNVLKKLKEKGLPVSLTFLGDGAEIEKVKQRANELGVRNEITFAGNVENVETYLKDANLYVHSAYSEAFGLVLLEAMAAGLPVVALDGKGNRDLIIDDENGILIDNQDADVFAEKIMGLVQDKTAYQVMSRTAVDFARGYDIKIYVTHLLKLYEKALAATV